MKGEIDKPLHRLRETRNIARSTLTTASGPLAEVLTYATRKIGGTWKFKTAVVGFRGSEQRAWFQEWPSWEAAELGHRGVCTMLHRDQGMTLQ